jgi:cytochrome P450 family 135
VTRPNFVVSTGRCGSTLVSEILATHPVVLSLSECLANVRSELFPTGQLTATEFWGYLSRPRGKLSLLLRHRAESNEIRYPIDAGLRFDRRTGLPPLSATCLPMLFEDPDDALDEIERDVAQFPTATVGDHFQRLFDTMAERMGRGMWVERSGGSLAGVGSLIANFPSARYVHLYRDGPACAASMSRHPMYRLEVLGSMLERELGYDPYERPDPSAREQVSGPLRSVLPTEFDADAFRAFEIPLERFGRMWSAIVLRGTRRLAALPPEDVLHVSYETLLVEPAAQIERLLGFIGLESPDTTWLAEAASKVRSPAEHDVPLDLALARACESGMRRLRALAGPSTAGEDGKSTARPAALRARRRAIADLPPGPSESVASLLGRFLADPEEVFSECHQRFGDCFTLPLPGVRRRLRPSVVVSDPKAITELFASGPALSTVAPSRFIMASTLGDESTFLLDDDIHLARRRLISAYFHGEPLRRWERLAAEIAEREVAAWPLDEPLELGPRLYGVVLEIILQVVLGDVDQDRLAELRRLVPGIWGDDGPRSLGWQGRTPGERPSRHAVDELLSAELRARREAVANGHTDVLSALLDASRQHQMLSDLQLRDELVTLLLAGHENSAAGMAWTFELLMRNPEALGRARRDAIGGDGTYLAALLREALRCKPPVMFVNRTLRRPWEAAGHRLPAGTDVAACIYLVHQRPDLYPEPERFRPERFLAGEPPHFSWLAFGAGLRRCLGAAFAEIEMREVLRAVLARAEPELTDPGPLPRGSWRSVVMRPSGVTPAVLRSRARDQTISVAM